MKLAAAFAALMLLVQTADFASERAARNAPAESPPQPRHMRFERAIAIPPGESGIVCTVLDAATLAHAASRSGDDLRVFSNAAAAAPAETPFALTESEAAPGDAEPATVEHLSLRNGVIAFDLGMPARPYTVVDLQIAAKNFVGTAKVWGLQASAPVRSTRHALSRLAVASPVPLGSFTIFDLSGYHLARSTELALQESAFPVLHVELRLRDIGTAKPGTKPAASNPAIMQGAEIPPSRVAQTLYTTVASSSSIHQDANFSTAEFRVPAHVPIERVTFRLDPVSASNFLRVVSIAARPGGETGIDSAEVLQDRIWRVTRAAAANGDEPAIHAEKLSVDAVLGANLRDPATITVAVNNHLDHQLLPPLPLREVKLEMRQRRICFDARPGASYTLYYGDPALSAPAYHFAPTLSPAPALLAQLGPEQHNPAFIARVDARPYAVRHPELVWIALLISTTVLGALAIESLKRKGRHT